MRSGGPQSRWDRDTHVVQQREAAEEGAQIEGEPPTREGAGPRERLANRQTPAARPQTPAPGPTLGSPGLTELLGQAGPVQVPASPEPALCLPQREAALGG